MTYEEYYQQDITSGNMERLNKDIERIGEATNKMERLLWDLLELSRIGRIVRPSEEIPFNDLVNEVMEIVHGQLFAHRVTVNIRPNLPTVFGDRQRLIEVLQNLLDNTAKYMGLSGRTICRNRATWYGRYKICILCARQWYWHSSSTS